MGSLADLDNDWYVESNFKHFETPISNLSVTHLLLCLVDEYTAVEAGLKADWSITDQLSVLSKISYNNNDFEGSSFEVEDSGLLEQE